MKRILIVEDDIDLGETVAQALSEEGYETEVAGDGRVALDALHRAPADLVLLDLMMPNMNGWEFRTLQVSEPSLAAIPVVVMTATSDLISAAIEANGLVRKPVALDDILSMVRRHVGEGVTTEFDDAPATEADAPIAVHETGSGPH